MRLRRLEGLYSGGIVRLVGALRLCLPGSTDSCSGRTYEELMPPYTEQQRAYWEGSP